jgi:hypothetical protein
MTSNKDKEASFDEEAILKQIKNTMFKYKEESFIMPMLNSKLISSNMQLIKITGIIFFIIMVILASFLEKNSIFKEIIYFEDLSLKKIFLFILFLYCVEDMKENFMMLSNDMIKFIILLGNALIIACSIIYILHSSKLW